MRIRYCFDISQIKHISHHLPIYLFTTINRGMDGSIRQFKDQQLSITHGGMVLLINQHVITYWTFGIDVPLVKNLVIQNSMPLMYRMIVA